MFGYDDDELVAHEADAIRNAYLALLNGASLGGIAKQWNEEGLRPLRAKAWTGATVRQLLKRERNAGLQVYQGEILEGVETTSPAIVERDVWDAACTVLADPKRRTGPETVGRKYLLSGLAICGECGQPMSTVIHTAGNRFRYACKRDGCMHVIRSIAPVDEYVVGVITHRLADPDAVVALTRPTIDTAPLRDAVAILRAQITQAHADYDRGARRRAPDERPRRSAHREAGAAGGQAARRQHLAHPRRSGRARRRGRAIRGTVTGPQARGDRHPRRVTINRSKLPQGSHRFDPSSIVIEWMTNTSAAPQVLVGSLTCSPPRQR